MVYDIKIPDDKKLEISEDDDINVEQTWFVDDFDVDIMKELEREEVEGYIEEEMELE